MLSAGGYEDVSHAGGTKLSRLQNHGLAGLLTDARLRDFSELARYDFATWCGGEATRWGGDTDLPRLPAVFAQWLSPGAGRTTTWGWSPVIIRQGLDKKTRETLARKGEDDDPGAGEGDRQRPGQDRLPASAKRRRQALLVKGSREPGVAGASSTLLWPSSNKE